MVAYKQDKEYMHYVGHLIATPKVQKLGKILIIITPRAWNIPSMSLIQAIRLRKNLVGMPSQQPVVVYCMIYSSMIGEIPNSTRAMLGFIQELLNAMLRNSFNSIN